jgi:hypothetical protein
MQLLFTLCTVEFASSNCIHCWTHPKQISMQAIASTQQLRIHPELAKGQFVTRRWDPSATVASFHRSSLTPPQPSAPYPTLSTQTPLHLVSLPSHGGREASPTPPRLCRAGLRRRVTTTGRALEDGTPGAQPRRHPSSPACPHFPPAPHALASALHAYLGSVWLEGGAEPSEEREYSH